MTLAKASFSTRRSFSPILSRKLLGLWAVRLGRSERVTMCKWTNSVFHGDTAQARIEGVSFQLAHGGKFAAETEQSATSWVIGNQELVLKYHWLAPWRYW